MRSFVSILNLVAFPAIPRKTLLIFPVFFFFFFPEWKKIEQPYLAPQPLGSLTSKTETWDGWVFWRLCSWIQFSRRFLMYFLSKKILPHHPLSPPPRKRRKQCFLKHLKSTLVSVFNTSRCVNFLGSLVEVLQQQRQCVSRDTFK